MMSEAIAIRSIQHFMYCPHRWGLIEIDKAWAENVFVTKANLLHDRVHDPKRKYIAKGKKVYTSVPVYNDNEIYNLYGVTDCLELIPDKDGVSINGSKETYRIQIVEYKSTKPKNQEYREDDLIQVFAQKLCVDYVFGGNCEGIIYYIDVKKRVSLPLRENFKVYDKTLQNLLKEMRYNLELGKIPPIKKKQKCNGCSMKDLCMPTLKKSQNLWNEIKKIEENQL